MAWNRNKPWNRKWGFRSRTRRRIPMKALPKSVAKKQYQWVTVYNDTCTARCMPFDLTDCGVSNQVGLIELIDVQSLVDLFGDNVTIAKMVGEFWLRPWITAPTQCNTAGAVLEWITATNLHFITLRASMAKRDLSVTQALDPLPYPDPLNGFDWSEFRWLKERRFYWPSKGFEYSQTWRGAGDVTQLIGGFQNGYTVPATVDGNQDSYLVPAAQYECAECTESSEDCEPAHRTIHAISWPWKRLGMTSSRKIQLRDSDSLGMYLNMARIRPDVTNCPGPCVSQQTDFSLPCRLELILNLKMLLQHG